MAIERKPLAQPEGPGYPDAKEYATGRRAFLWLLGAGAVGVAGVYAWKATRPGEPLTGSGTRTAGVPPKPVPATVQPQARPPGEAAPQANPADATVAPQPPGATAGLSGSAPPRPPQTDTDGVLRPVQPPARPQAVLRGEPPAVEPPAKDPPPAQPLLRPAGAPPAPKNPPAQPVVPPPGTPPAPARTDAPPPAQPAARLLGEAAAPARPQARSRGAVAAPKGGVN
jgi:hypothetical protein